MIGNSLARGYWMVITPVLALLASAATASTPPVDTAAVPAAHAGEDALFGDLPVVEAATLHAQSLQEAPASVTIVTAQDIRRYGYRTLGEVLMSVRGFTVTSDYSYLHAGVRGFNIPGDNNSRFLVMINGHSITEIVYNSANFFDQDFGLDLDLVDRIEIIRGPNSALYGSNGILASVNLVTRSPADAPRAWLSTETGTLGRKKLAVMSSQPLGHGANLLVSASGFSDSGQRVYAPEADITGANGGFADRVDAQSGYHSFLNLSWGAWNVTGYFNSRLKRAPILGGDTLFNSSGQFVRDDRNFASVTYTRELKDGSQLRWQAYYDQYRYDDRYDYPEGDGVLSNRTWDWGDWLSGRLSYSHPVKRIGTLTVGLQGTVELRNLQVNANVSPLREELLRISAPDQSMAPFVQQEWNLTGKLTAYLGARLDFSRNYGNFLSPRVALVYQANPRTVYKLVYGRPFRTPSAFERFYDDGLMYSANPLLHAETAHTFELSAERKLGPRWNAIVNAYHYRLDSVIQVGSPTSSLQQYQNIGSQHSTGAEVELEGHPVPWLEMVASLALDRARDAGSGLALPNAPATIAKLRGSIPLIPKRLHLSSSLMPFSRRLTTAGQYTRPVVLWDATVSTTRLFRELDLVAGIRNILGWRYEDPVSLDPNRIRATGRTAFLKVIWQWGE